MKLWKCECGCGCEVCNCADGVKCCDECTCGE